MKKYITPEIRTIQISSKFNIQAGSGVGNGNSIHNEYRSGDISYSRETDDLLWE